MAAIDDDFGTRHEPAGIGGQQEQRPVEILELSQPALRDP